MGFKSFQGPDFSFESLAPEQGSVHEQLSAWYRRALGAGRVPVVYLTASWCPPSVKLEKSLDDPRMQRALREIDAATFDVDVWAKELTEAGYVAHSVPIFFVVGVDGQPVGGTIHGGAWGENTPENMAPPLERFFDAARAARPAPVQAAGASKLRGVLMLVVALVLIGVAAWLKVSSDEQRSRASEAADRDERIRQDVERSIKASLEAQKK
jgi:hypothetical protein